MCLFPDLYRISHVIRVSMCNQNKIDMVERSDFIFASFENRIRQPRIDEQNFSARGHNLESRLTVPSKLRIHGKSRNRKAFARQEVTRRMTNHEYCRAFL